MGIFSSSASSVRKLFTDTFNRGDQSGIGTASDGTQWDILNGSFSISSNKLSASAGTSYPLATVDFPDSDVNVSLAGVSQGISTALWVTDSGNWWAVGIDQQTDTACNCSTCHDCIATDGGTCAAYNTINSPCTAYNTINTPCGSYNTINNPCGSYNTINSPCGGYNTVTSACASYNTVTSACNGYNTVTSTCNGGYNTVTSSCVYYNVATCSAYNSSTCRTWLTINSCSAYNSRTCRAYNASNCAAYSNTGGTCKGYTNGGGSCRVYTNGGGSCSGYSNGGGSCSGYYYAGGSCSSYYYAGGSCSSYYYAGGSCSSYTYAGGSCSGTAYNTINCTTWNSYTCNCQTCYPQYVRIFKSVNSVVSEVTSWLVSSVVGSFKVQTSGSQITTKVYSDNNLVSQIGTDLVYTPTNVSFTNKFGIVLKPSGANQGQTVDEINIARN